MMCPGKGNHLPFLLIIFFVMVFSAIALLPATVFCDETQKIRVGFFDLEGFNEVDSDGTLSGFGYEYLMELSKYNQWEYEFVTEVPTLDDNGNETGEMHALTLREAVEMVESGDLDIVGSVRKTEEREETLFYPNIPAGYSVGILSVLENNTKYSVEDPESFYHIIIGVLRGNSRIPEIKEYMKGIGIDDCEYKVYDTNDELFYALHRSKEIDAIYNSNLRKTYNEKKVLDMVGSPFYFVTTKGNEKISQELDHAILHLTEDHLSFTATLFEKYYHGSDSEMQMLTSEEKEYINNNPVVRVGVDSTFYPFEYTDPKTGELKGTVSLLLDNISQRTGLKFEYVLPEQYEDNAVGLRKGTIDMVASCGADYEWAEHCNVKLSSSFLNLPITAIVRDDAQKYNNSQLSVALVKGYYLSSLVQKKYSYPKVFWFDTMEECIRAVNRGDVGITYLPTYSADYFSSNKTFTHIVNRSLPDFYYSVALGVSQKANPLLYQILNKTISAIPTTTIERYRISGSMEATNDRGFVEVIYKYPILVLVLIFVLFGLIFLFIIHRRRLLHHNEAERKYDEERLHLALQKTDIVVWDYDVHNQKMNQTVDGQIKNGLPLVLENVPESLIANGYIHEESVDEIRNLFEAIRNGEKHACCVIRVRIRDNGKWTNHFRWERISLTAVSIKKEETTWAVGIVEDATEEMNTRLKYDRFAQFRNAIVSDAIAHYEVDLTHATLIGGEGYIHKLIPNIMEKPTKDTVAEIAERFIYKDDRDAFLNFFTVENLLEGYRQGNKELRFECRAYYDNNNTYRWLEHVVYFIVESISSDIHCTIVQRDIHKEKNVVLELEDRAKKDPLTKLLNRETLQKQVEKIIEEDHDGKTVFALFMMDLDNFKGINDHFGHETGDKILVDIAAVLRDSFRNSDFIGRLGGDEFIAVMRYGASMDVVQSRCQHLCRSLRFLVDDVEVTCTVGVALYPKDGKTFNDLYAHADIAFYRGKSRGKRNYVIYDKDDYDITEN